uniref:Uncharacterized protein n=1 Tax=Arundo donax TaxID=35708 RepID=A0A0A9FV34_ARUDO
MCTMWLIEGKFIQSAWSCYLVLLLKPSQDILMLNLFV